MAALILIVGLVIFVIATMSYARWVEKCWGVDGSRPTPANTINDGVDYVPTPKIILFGHHFSSIAGAAPVVGAITAAAYGWLPVAIWCITACVFIGGVHDFGALYASVRHGGSTIGDVIRKYAGVPSKQLFCIFAWFTTILLAAAFYDIVANTFVSTPAAGTASMLFILWSVLYGLSVNKLGVNRNIATVIGVFLTFFSVWIGIKCPLVLPHTTWILILIAYTAIAAVAPVWILLQPRDFLNSFLLYAMMAASIIGIIIYRPSVEVPAFTMFVSDGKPLFPIVFVTLACGAISGFHSLVGSGTTSKQVNNERDMRLIAYGGMLMEGVLALLALVTFIFLPNAIRNDVASKGALYVFSNGIGTFMTKVGIPYEIGLTFGGLALSAFAMTTLDTAMRLARYLVQEFGSDVKFVSRAMKNPYGATAISMVVAIFLAFCGYSKIWPIFGSANQLLASIAFLCIVVWLKSMGRKYIMCILPMLWMCAVSVGALLFNSFYYVGSNWVVVILSVLLLIVAFFLFAKMYKIFKSSDMELK